MASPVAAGERGDPRQGPGPRGDAARVELLDPHSGRAAAAVFGEQITWSTAAVRRYQDRRIDLFDHASLRPLGSVDLASIGLANAAGVDAAPTDEGIVVASATAAVLVDGSGTVRATLPLDAPTSAEPSPRCSRWTPTAATWRSERGVRLTVVATAGGQLSELWSDDAWVLDAVVAGVAGSSPPHRSRSPR